MSKIALAPLRPLLELLADGELHSGESLGAALGVSRAAVWKQLQKLEQLGLPVESEKGRGYRLVGGLDLLSVDAIQSQLSVGGQSLLGELQVLDQVDSTNARVLDRMEAGAGHGLVVLAEQQTAGRGRRGRQWVSPFAAGISLSIGWQFQGGVQILEGLSLAVGVALARALERFDVPDVRLKWPNDVWCQGRKLAGVLLELSGDLTDRCGVVVGVGLNVGLAEGAARQIDQPWVDLAAVRPGLGRNSLTAAMLEELLPLLEEYPRIGFAGYREAWSRLDQFSGQEISLYSGPTEWRGRNVGVDESGALLLEVDGEIRRFHGGEVSLRGRRAGE
ncbi:bifunctional biotin operon transcriptional regulator/biotin--[acetyl-CoA-carboxylase] ligase [Microbulbifer flavimaris]|uniref:Bifunctional ligase/repressor BirA n=1 Tax=Microbulbifer flavimaris TaxID=1781068 RepID=A0ABX4HVF2_9GAMM|nr:MULTISPECIES: bifunctional biotin--[acetyl-CoA-carboxylase] ligase/biotin operon repressor BirA [Microbulbifer]KUJ78775.1 repressor [Microbulbifer sp. ZGT114]PCO04066.1 bifunctional biotin operon transcriptional regulator/biotin--[acetyl-CoA-carboxylase] ligase [Microbulbifer flavimaris]